MVPGIWITATDEAATSNVRFGSGADIAICALHVGFGSEADIERSATNVSFGPLADVGARALGMSAQDL